MRKIVAFILLMTSANILYANDNFKREPNDSLDYDIYEDLDIEKSGRYYLTLSPGISIIDNALGQTGVNISFPKADYIASLSFGSNFHKYIGTEITFSHEGLFYRKNGAVEYTYSFVLGGYITGRYAFQPKHYLSIIPFVAVGINGGVMIVSGNSELLTTAERLQNEYLGKRYIYAPTFGLSAKAGVRFKIYDFLIGAGLIYNMSTTDITMKNLNIALELGWAF